MLEKGVHHGSRIAVLSRNHTTMLIVLQACAKIGAITVPLNSRLAATELLYIVENSQPDLLFYEDLFEDLLTPEIQTASNELVIFGAQKPIESVLVGYTTELPPQQVSEQDPYVIIYTSGTTGKPKGVVITHQNLEFVARNFAVELSVQLYDRFFLPTPLFHISGIMFTAFDGSRYDLNPT